MPINKRAVEHIDVDEVERGRLADVYQEYEACKHLFRKRQWLAIQLFYGEGKTQQEIATLLRITRSAVCGLLSRARKRKAQHDRELRAEQFNVMRQVVDF